MWRCSWSIFFWNLVLQVSQIVVSCESIETVDRINVIGRETLRNEEQCRRLCWYRKLCTSFTYNKTDRPNCLLHSRHVQEDSANHTRSLPSWTESLATEPKRSNGCGKRPCGAREICVPAPMGEYRCLDHPAQCESHHSQGALETSFVHQEEKNTVVCQDHFVVSPRNSSMAVNCQVNSRWTTTFGQCLQAEFHWPELHKVLTLPWSVIEGWGCCIKGTFLDLETITFSFLSSNSHDILLCLKLWNNYDRLSDGISYKFKNISHWDDVNIPTRDTTLQEIETFTLGFKLTANGLLFILYDHDLTFTILRNTSPTIRGTFAQTADFRYLAVSDPVNLTYVNLVSDCKS